MLPAHVGSGYQTDCHDVTVLGFTEFLFYLTAPKFRSSDAGNVDMPKRSSKVQPVREKVSTVQ